MTAAISVAGLTRRCRGQRALDQVSFDIEPSPASICCAGWCSSGRISSTRITGAASPRHALRAASWFYPGWDAGLAPSVPLGAATVANDLVFTTLETVS
jgi:hypothetical protein